VTAAFLSRGKKKKRRGTRERMSVIGVAPSSPRTQAERARVGKGIREWRRGGKTGGAGTSGIDPIANIHLVGHIGGMAAKRGGMTAREHLTRLEADPDYVAMRKAKDLAHANLVEQHRLEQQPLLKDLAAVGVIVDSIGRLCSFSDLDERIYPVLLDHLTRPYSPHLLEWIGRAFGRKSARPIVWDTLVKLIKAHRLEKPAVEGVMVAISDMAQPRDLATLIDLLSDRSIGVSRIFLVSNLMRSKKPEARAALLLNQGDPDLATEIAARLARSRR
jgi:hypothetical protein